MRRAEEVLERISPAPRTLLVLRGCIQSLVITTTRKADMAIKVIRKLDFNISDALYIAPGEDGLASAMREAEGAKSLLLEIIRRAAYDWVLYKDSDKPEHKQLASEACTWIFLEDEEHPYWAIRQKEGRTLTSFIGICRVLDMDPIRIRSYITRLTPNKVMSAGRSRKPKAEVIALFPDKD